MPTTSKPRRAARHSLFQSGLGVRLAFAGTFSVVVWLAIAWALAA